MLLSTVHIYSCFGVQKFHCLKPLCRVIILSFIIGLAIQVYTCCQHTLSKLFHGNLSSNNPEFQIESSLKLTTQPYYETQPTHLWFQAPAANFLVSKLPHSPRHQLHQPLLQKSPSYSFRERDRERELKR